MAGLFTRGEWETLARLYGAGRRGILSSGGRYPAAGPWGALQTLKTHDPPLAREMFRRDDTQGEYLYYMMITEAGVRFYEKNRRMYNAFYPSQR